MHAYSTDGWGELFLAGVGASAALAGLLFVAISINLERILQGVGLPGQSLTVVGAELLGAGLVAWLILVGSMCGRCASGSGRTLRPSPAGS